MPITFRFLPLYLLVALFVVTGCAPMELSSVVDTQFLLGSRDLPMSNVLVVYDSRDLTVKQEFELAFSEYLEANSAVKAHTDIELYSPLKKLSEKEKEWALRDNNIDGVLYISGGGSGRSLREWLLPESPDIDIETQAWKSSDVRIFLPTTAQVVWAGSLQERDAVLNEDFLSRGFYSAVTSDLVRRGILDIPRVANPGLRGFNR